MGKRISKDAYYLGIAKAVSARSSCLRRAYGAIIVVDDEVRATGYNGAVRSDLNCCDKENCSRIDNNLPHGTCYDDCFAIHAEMNAIMSLGRFNMSGGILYLYGFDNETHEELPDPQPCNICSKLIRASGLELRTLRWVD